MLGTPQLGALEGHLGLGAARLCRGYDLARSIAQRKADGQAGGGLVELDRQQSLRVAHGIDVGYHAQVTHVLRLASVEIAVAADAREAPEVLVL